MEKVLTPVKSIRAYCIGCMNGSKPEVRKCHLTACEFHPYRMGKRANKEIYPDYTFTPIKAIRAKCLDCVCGQKKEIENCEIIDCEVFAYRRGKRPKKDVS